MSGGILHHGIRWNVAFFSLLVSLSQDSHMLRKIVTDDEERHDVWFVPVHAWACDVASRTAARMAVARTAAAAPVGHSA